MSKYSNKLKLVSFFKEISFDDYVIVKRNDVFPDYYPGSDIDLFTTDIEFLSREILSISQNFISDRTAFKLTKVTDNHVHIDHMYEENIDFRFDIYGSIPPYQKIDIKDYLLYSIIDRKKEKKIQDCSEQKCTIFVPNHIDDLLIRYFEYLEYYQERPEKIKHLDYVYEDLESLNEEKRKIFFERLHLYTDMPDGSKKSNRFYFANKYLSTFKFYFSKFKQYGLIGSLKRFTS